MFDCKRCGNTGRVTEQYTELPSLAEPMDAVTLDSIVEIKTRWRECPECLGFSTVPLRLRDTVSENEI